MTDRVPASSVRTLLFSDVEGSTSLLERTGDRYADLIGRHRIIVRQAIVQHGGVEHGTEGDSFFISFDSPSAALASAVQMQRGLHAEPWPHGCEVRVRMGVHVGEVSAHAEGPVGLAIHHAARVAAAAHGGQLIVSEDVRRLGSALPPDVGLKPLGDHRLRDMGTVAIFQVTHLDLPSEFPPLRAMPSSRSNLPRIAEPLVGQDEMIDGLVDALAQATLLTLTGTGGVGKTRLAVELARRVSEQFEDGVWLIELAAATEPAAVMANVFSTLSIPPQPEMSLRESMLDWMRKRTMVLVVDNCEHVVEEAAELVVAIMDSCPAVRLVATSREPLGVSGERVHRVASLGLEHAAELFVERMMAADQTVTIDARDRDVVLDICRRLDGIPLAIQLAAARTRSMSLVDVLDRLGDRFRLLRGGARGARDRHQTLQATVTWSYLLLSADEQLTFDRLSVFAGGFDLAAAEYVCAGDGIDQLDVAELLHALVDKSMVLSERTGSATRFRLLETLRQYGEDRLDQTQSLARMRDRHLHWYVGSARKADAFVLTSRHADGNRMFEIDWDNIRAAQSWAVVSRQFDIAVDVVSSCFHYSVNHVRSEHCEWVDRLLIDLPAGDSNATNLLGQSAYWRANVLGEDARAHELARRGIQLAFSPDHSDTLRCWASLSGANIVTAAGSDASESSFSGLCAAIEKLEAPDRHWESMLDLVDACLWGHDELIDVWFPRLLAMAQRVESPSLDIYVHLMAGHIELLDVPDAESSMRHYLEALDISREIGDVRGMGNALRAVAMATCVLGDPTALARSVEALDHLFHLRFWQKAYQTLDDVAYALAASGHLGDAAVVVGFMQHEVPNGGGIETDLGFRAWVMQQIQELPARDAMLQRGAAMTRDEIAMFVLHESAARLAV